MSNKIQDFLDSIFRIAGLTQEEALKIKSDLEELVKIKTVNQLTNGLGEQNLKIIQDKVKKSGNSWEEDLVSMLKDKYDKEVIKKEISSVANKAIGDYLDFLMRNSNDDKREQLLAVFKKFKL